jgi:hypothetical protein
MQLVDDMRVVMMKQDTKKYDSKDTDIYFIFNQQDEQEAMIIVDELSMEYPVETLNILPEGEDSYREMSSQQIPKSKLAVVYFKYAADWALPFIKQIWKQVGGLLLLLCSWLVKTIRKVTWPAILRRPVLHLQ